MASTIPSIDNAIWGLRASESALTIPFPDKILITAQSVPSDKDGVKCAAAFFLGDTVLYSESSGKSTVGLQGQTSANSNKHNLKIKLKSANGKVNLRFGTWCESTSVTLKAYGDIPGNVTAFDRTMVREAVCLDLWRQIRRDDPQNMGHIAPWYARLNQTTTLFQQPLYSCDCRPVVVYFQTAEDTTPQFFGCYMLRSDNPPETYLLDTANAQHYQLQPQHGGGDLWTNVGNLSGTLWEYSSPDAPDSAVPARLLKWFKAVLSGADTWANYYNYLGLTSWVDYIIHIEAVGSFDSTVNNLMLKSYTGTETSGLWEIDAYDLDESLGVKWNEPNGAAPDTTGWASDGANVFQAMRAYFAPQIEARYAYLRQSVLTAENMASLLRQYATFRVEDLQQDWALYGTNSVSNYQYIQNWFEGRLAWLDAQWDYSA